MGVTVLNMDVVCEDSGHQVVPCGPNTCITPGVVAGAPRGLGSVTPGRRCQRERKHPGAAGRGSFQEL